MKCFSIAEALKMQPLSLSGNPRAAALTGKDLLDQMRCHRENMAALGTYSVAIQFDIGGHGPPPRPQMKTP